MSRKIHALIIGITIVTAPVSMSRCASMKYVDNPIPRWKYLAGAGPSGNDSGKERSASRLCKRVVGESHYPLEILKRDEDTYYVTCSNHKMYRLY